MGQPSIRLRRRLGGPALFVTISRKAIAVQPTPARALSGWLASLAVAGGLRICLDVWHCAAMGMPSARSVDLRERVTAAGSSRQQAVKRIEIGRSSGICWHERFQAEGKIAPVPSYGLGKRSHRASFQ